MILAGCQPKPDAGDLVKNMVVSTQYDNTTDFTKYSTYYLALDTVSYFNSDDPYAADTLQCDACNGYSNQLGSYPGVITSEVKARLDAIGYKQVPRNQNPDLKIYVFIIENYNVSQSYNYSPYGYGYGYGFGYGGGYYPTVSVSDQADLYIEIFDLTNHSKPLWLCDIGDLVSSPDPNGSITIRSIDQAFQQSSYIKKK